MCSKLILRLFMTHCANQEKCKRQNLLCILTHIFLTIEWHKAKATLSTSQLPNNTKKSLTAYKQRHITFLATKNHLPSVITIRLPALILRTELRSADQILWCHHVDRKQPFQDILLHILFVLVFSRARKHSFISARSS